jgi:hypothetical protein
MLDLNDAPEQRSTDLIPDGTVCMLQITVRPGGAGPEGWLKRSKDGGSEALDCELTVVEGPHSKQKLWDLMTVAGTTSGHQKAAEITSAKLRGILESARGIRPDDNRPEARAARQVNSYGDFDGLRFVGKIGIEKGTGNFRDKNKLLEAITPDRQIWRKPEQIAKVPGQGAQAQPSLIPAQGQMQKPNWAG